jgi:hypothetical protein
MHRVSATASRRNHAPGAAPTLLRATPHSRPVCAGLPMLLSPALDAAWALAANILFVSDSGADLGIATALMTDGHVVTTRARGFAGGTHAALSGDLREDDAAYRSQDGDGDTITDRRHFQNLLS